MMVVFQPHIGIQNMVIHMVGEVGLFILILYLKL